MNECKKHQSQGESPVVHENSKLGTSCPFQFISYFQLACLRSTSNNFTENSNIKQVLVIEICSFDSWKEKKTPDNLDFEFYIQCIIYKCLLIHVKSTHVNLYYTIAYASFVKL